MTLPQLNPLPGSTTHVADHSAIVRNIIWLWIAVAVQAGAIVALAITLVVLHA